MQQNQWTEQGIKQKGVGAIEYCLDTQIYLNMITSFYGVLNIME